MKKYNIVTLSAVATVIIIALWFLYVAYTYGTDGPLWIGLFLLVVGPKFMIMLFGENETFPHNESDVPEHPYSQMLREIEYEGTVSFKPIKDDKS